MIDIALALHTGSRKLSLLYCPLAFGTDHLEDETSAKSLCCQVFLFIVLLCTG